MKKEDMQVGGHIVDVEMYIGYIDRTWDTTTIQVTRLEYWKDRRFEDQAVEKMLDIAQDWKTPVAFVGVYHYEEVPV